MKPVSWLLILLLIVLHQDYWNWKNDTLVLGFLPIQLAYHMVISLLAAALWWRLVSVDWPIDRDLATKSTAGEGESS